MQPSTLSEQQRDLPCYKVIVLGIGAAGKTKLLTRYIYGSYVDSGQQTIMVDCSFKKRPEAIFAYYDTAGQEMYRSILNLYFKGSNAAILIYSINSQKSFEEIAFYHQKMQEQAPECQLFIIGCKGDLETEVRPEDVAEKYPGIRHFVTSAKNNLGVTQAFLSIEKSLSQTKSSIQRTNGIDLRASVKPKSKKKPCCS